MFHYTQIKKKHDYSSASDKFCFQFYLLNLQSEFGTFTSPSGNSSSYLFRHLFWGQVLFGFTKKIPDKVWF